VDRKKKPFKILVLRVMVKCFAVDNLIQHLTSFAGFPTLIPYFETVFFLKAFLILIKDHFELTICANIGTNLASDAIGLSYSDKDFQAPSFLGLIV